MRDYIVEDGTGHIPWSSVIGVEHLNPNSTYRNYLNEINSTLGPEYTLSLSLDYESMKLLLKQAQEYNVPFIESNKLKAVFIIKNRNKTVAKRLLIEEGYTDAENLISIIDPYV